MHKLAKCVIQYIVKLFAVNIHTDTTKLGIMLKKIDKCLNF